MCVRWKDVVQALEDDGVRAGASLSLWQEYSRLSETCSLHLRDLSRQWEELTSSRVVLRSVQVSSGCKAASCVVMLPN